jgi:hypothetical protein
MSGHDLADAPATKPAGIGDVTSDRRGTGARFNTGKTPLELIPLRLVAANYLGTKPDGQLRAVGALYHLGWFQETHNADHLHKALHVLGREGWAECAKVFEYGRAKYAAWNWLKGQPWSVPLACAARHLVQMIDGEPIDAESKLPHRGHVFCNGVMLLQFVKSFPGGNDLPPVELFQREAA